MKAGDLEIELRAVTPGDLPVLLRFIRDMAAFERLTVSTTEETLHEALFGAERSGHAMLAVVGGEPIGYVTYAYTFSSMTGKSVLSLDDLYVEPSFRNKGVGTAIMRYLARLATEKNCSRFEWTVLDWNDRAIGFYKGLGAKILDDWRIARLEGESLSALGSRRAANGTSR